MKLRRFLIASAAIATLTGVMAGGALAADISATYNTETGIVTVAGCPDFEGDKTLLVLDTNADGSLLTEVKDTQINQIAQQAEVYTDVVVGPLENGTYEVRIGGDGTISTCTFTVGETESTRLLGDVDNDTEITGTDAVQVINHVASVATLEGEDFIAADTDSDNSVTGTDAVQIVNYVAGVDSSVDGVTTIKK